MTTPFSRSPRNWPGRVAIAGCTVLLGPSGIDSASADGPAPPTSCEVSELPASNDAVTTWVSAGDPSGRYLVGQFSVDEPRTVDTPGQEPTFTDVNENGVAVGLPGVDNGEAYSINARGDISGIDDGQPVRWTAETGDAEKLELPADPQDFLLTRIADGGTVVGRPLGAEQVIHVQAEGSKVAATATKQTTGGSWSVLWDLADPAQPKVISRDVWDSGAVNRHGWIVGWAGNQGTGFASLEGGNVVLEGLSSDRWFGNKRRRPRSGGSLELLLTYFGGCPVDLPGHPPTMSVSPGVVRCRSAEVTMA